MVIFWLVATTAIVSGFCPSVRVDHENRPNHGCFHGAIALGPAPAGTQPVYVAFQVDSMVGIVTQRSDILFQRSTDRGATWLPQDVLIKRGQAFACYPDITTDSRGAVYVVYTEGVDNLHSHVYCVRSTDQGATWSSPVAMDDNPSPVPIGWARIAADSADNLFAAWNGNQTGQMRIWASISTDRGATWSQNVRVDDDTVPMGCFHTDVAVQPQTNHLLVTASSPYWVRPGQIGYHSYFYRSTDLGRTFQPGVQLDLFDGYCGQPHVVADAEHIICNYTGTSSSSGNQSRTEARTLYTVPDTWGPRVPVTYLDSLHVSELNGNKLAISADSRVHIALMIFSLTAMQYGIFYGLSADHGASWSDRERVNEDSVSSQSDPDIAVDSTGFAYFVWQDGRNNRQEIRFSTNAVTGMAEHPAPIARRSTLSISPNPVRGSVVRFCNLHSAFCNLNSSSALLRIFDASGRLVHHSSFDIRTSALALDLCPLAAGVYMAEVNCGGESASTRLVLLKD